MLRVYSQHVVISVESQLLAQVFSVQAPALKEKVRNFAIAYVYIGLGVYR